MLTIRTPLELTVNPSILTISDNFTSRMIDNYNQINADIEATDMMHFISAPAEVYVGEGGMTSLIESRNIFENQEIKVNIINSVLNRILTSDSYHMTYQDTVFINNTLRKMGIENVSEFLTQVKELKEETKNINELIDLYWNGGEILEQYRSYMEQVNISKEADSEDGESGNAYYLHQSIFNRLSTGAIYQELQNFANNHYNRSSVITETELQMSEQNMVASNILLNKLKNYYSYEDMPLEYNRLNIYEFGDVSTSEYSSQHTDSELISAVVLNALTQMYAARYSDIIRNDNVWFRIENALYETAYNTYERFNSYHNKLGISRDVTNQYISMMREYHEGELQALTNLVEQRDISNSSVTTYLENREENTSVDESTFEQAAQYMDNSQLINYVNQVVQNNNTHNQQIIRVTEQEKLMKQQLDFFNQQNIIRQQELVHQVQNNQFNSETNEFDSTSINSQTQVRNDNSTSIEHSELQNRLNQITNENRTNIVSNDRLLNEIKNIQSNTSLDQMTMANQILMQAISNPPEFSLEYLMNVTNPVQVQPGMEYVTEEVPGEIITNTRRRSERLVRNIDEREFTQVELTHKVEESTISEEVLEEIQNRVTVTNRNIEHTVETVNQTEKVQEIVTNQINQMQARTTQELESMVSRNVSSQLGNIYDQVYSKLEKKMESERRRRGL